MAYPGEETTAYDPSMDNRAIGAQLRAPSELERCFQGLDKLMAVISELDARLDPVLNRTPEDGMKEPGHDRPPHLAMVGDGIGKASRRLQIIVDQLAL